METAKISSKGQLVIPKSIREKLSLEENATLIIDAVDGGIYMRPVQKEDFLRWMRKVRHTSKELLDKEIQQEIRQSRA